MNNLGRRDEGFQHPPTFRLLPGRDTSVLTGVGASLEGGQLPRGRDTSVPTYSFYSVIFAQPTVRDVSALPQSW